MHHHSRRRVMRMRVVDIVGLGTMRCVIAAVRARRRRDSAVDRKGLAASVIGTHDPPKSRAPR